MDDILRIIHKLTLKVEKLDTHVHKLTQQRDSLSNELEAERARNKADQEALVELEQKYEAAKLVKDLGEGQNHEEIKTKIDSYLKDIDICLEYFLNQSIAGEQ